MEKRALLAIALSVAILVGWQWLFAPPSPPPPTSAPEPAPAPGVPPGLAPSPTPPLARPIPGPATPAGRRVEVRTPRLRAIFDGDGAASAWTLLYRGSKPLALGTPIGPLAVALLRADQGAEVVPLAPQSPDLELSPAQPTGTLTFRGRSRDGLEVEKVLGFGAESYAVQVALRLMGRVPGDTRVALYWTSPVVIAGAPGGAPWVTLGEGSERQQLLGRILVSRARALSVFEPPGPHLLEGLPAGAPPQLRDQEGTLPLPPAVVPVERGWVALENDYFIAALIPSQGASIERGRTGERADVALVLSGTRADGPWESGALVYAGPKEWDRLAALDVGLEQAQARNYGGFPVPLPYGLPMQWFCVPLLWLMNFLAGHLPGGNYGLAIILLTVLVKIAFYPLTRKSMTSMKQMQALQPQLNALRSKYKSEPQRFQREQMELFRKHKVNPMGGCLPMIIQIPVFYALYLTLQYSVELQGAPFLLWITDLSKKDPYYILPILMGASMFVQQLMTPTVGDPRQAKLMLLMPVIFTVMFLEFPTGLVLYWLVNNVLSIAQQHLIDRAAARKATPVVDAKAAREAPKT
jgi:YidC/Oxa1 family membrane protein insertase